MQTKLGVLLELQKLDTRLKELEALRGDLPQKVHETQNRINTLDVNLDTKTQQMQQNELEQKQLALELKEAEQNLKHYQEQLYRVTTNREYDAITHEIEAVRTSLAQMKNRKNVVEEENLELMENIAELEKQKNAEIGHLEALEKELQDKLSVTNREEENLRLQRQNLITKIDRQMFNTYERVRKAKYGQAVVALQRNACGGCFNAIPPQRLMEIREKKSFITCEFCGRILVWDENQSSL